MVDMSNLISILRKKYYVIGKNVLYFVYFWARVFTKDKTRKQNRVRYRYIRACEIQHKIHADKIESTMFFFL